MVVWAYADGAKATAMTARMATVTANLSFRFMFSRYAWLGGYKTMILIKELEGLMRCPKDGGNENETCMKLPESRVKCWETGEDDTQKTPARSMPVHRRDRTYPGLIVGDFNLD